MSVTSAGSGGGSITKGDGVDEQGVPMHGCLELGVIAAMGLSKAEFLRKSNTYATVTFNNELIGQTEVIPSSQDPFWDASFIIPVPYGQDLSLCTLEMHVYHRKSESVQPVLLGYRRFASSELLYLGNLADEMAAYDNVSEAQSDEDGPPPDLGVFQLHLEHKPADTPKKTKGRLQLIGNFHPHLARVLVEDEDEEDAATREAREVEEVKKNPHRAYFSLEVQLLAARDIANANGIAGSFQGKSNPFGIYRMNGYEIHRTAVLADTLDPVWHSEVVEVRIPMGVDFLNTVLELELWHSVHPRKSRRSKLLGYHSFNANQIAEMAGVTVLEIVCSAEQTHKQMMEYYDLEEGSELDSDEEKGSDSDQPQQQEQQQLPLLRQGSMLRRNSTRPISRGKSSAGLGRSLSRSPSRMGGGLGEPRSQLTSPDAGPLLEEGEGGSLDESSALSSMVNTDIFEKGIPMWLELQRHMKRPKEDALLIQGNFNIYMNFKTPPSAAEALAPLPLAKKLLIAGDFNAVSNAPTRDHKKESVLVVSVLAIRGICVQESLEKARLDAAADLDDTTSKNTVKSALGKNKTFTNTSAPPLYCALRNMYGEIVGKTQALPEDLSTRWQGEKFWLTFPVSNHDHFPCIFNLEVYHRAGSLSSVQDILVGEATISAKDILRACTHPDYRLQDRPPPVGVDYNPFLPASGVKWCRLEKPPEELEFDGLFFNDGEQPVLAGYGGASN